MKLQYLFSAAKASLDEFIGDFSEDGFGKMKVENSIFFNYHSYYFHSEGEITRIDDSRITEFHFLNKSYKIKYYSRNISNTRYEDFNG